MVVKMRKLFVPLYVAVSAMLVSSCGLGGNQKTPEGYVRYCVKLPDGQALYADTPEWKATRDSILAAAKSLASMDEAHDAVSKAAAVAGGKHSRLVAPVTDTASYEEVAPQVKLLDGNVAYVVVPAHSGVKVSNTEYIDTILDFLQANNDASGVVLDLRDNRGGNMYPMIAAVSPLLPDGVLLSFKGRKRTMPIPLDYVLTTSNLGDVAIEKFPESTPVAILINEWTASSGEATLLCFRGLDNVRTFGAPTAGYASANTMKNLADGYQLLITTSCDMARTGEVFCDDPIAPDVPTDTPLEDALAWIGQGR